MPRGNSRSRTRVVSGRLKRVRKPAARTAAARQCPSGVTSCSPSRSRSRERQATFPGEARPRRATVEVRSEERRVGKECRSRGSPDHKKKKNEEAGREVVAGQAQQKEDRIERRPESE